MTITLKELAKAPQFEAIATFVEARARNGTWPATYTFDFFGAQIGVEVEDTDVEKPICPEPGTCFKVNGYMRTNARTGSLSLRLDKREFIAKDLDELTAEQLEQYVQPLVIRGVAQVKEKASSKSPSGETYYRVTLAWPGSTQPFPNMDSAIWSQFPSHTDAENYVRIELSILLRKERTATGQTIFLQVPTITHVKGEPCVLNSMPSTTAKTTSGNGMSKAATATPPVAAPSTSMPKS